MPRIVRPLVRRLVTTAVVFAAVLAAPLTARAQDTPILKLKETNTLHANGDGRFVYEIKLPVAPYTALKKNTTNTAVLARKMGLCDQNAVVEGVTGEWLDGDSTLKLAFTSRGVARSLKGDTWEVSLFEGNDTDLVAVADGTAVLTQAANIPGLGLSTSTIRVTLPAGAGDVKALKNPARLSYRLPPPVVLASAGDTRGEMEVEHKEQVMTSLAKALSNKQFSALWTARAKFRNTGEQAIRDYRVRFRIAGYAPTWSPWYGAAVVVPGQTVVDGYFPVFEMDKIGRLTGQTRAALEIQYQYRNAAGKLVEDGETKEFTLLSRNQVYYSSLRPEDCADWSDRFNLGAVVVASFVTHEDPVIQQAAGRVAKWAGGANATGSDEEALKYMAAVYQFMGENIAYQTPPFGESDKKFIQHVKYGRDVLKNKAGTCIDLAILYGSLCQAVGLDPVLYNIPGHCFPAVKLPRSGRIIPVESTMIGKAGFPDAVKFAAEKHVGPMQSGQLVYDEAHIAKLHKKGAVPMDLPGVGEDPLDKWGVKMPAPAAARTEPARPATAGGNRPAAAPHPAVGTWKTAFQVNGLTVGGAFILKPDGGFEGGWVVKGPNGTNQVTDTGTWSLSGDKLTIRGDSTGAVVRTIKVDGDNMQMGLAEFGNITVTWTRVK